MASTTITTPAATADGAATDRTVRDAAFDVLRERGLTTLFANPGSTEIPLLSGLPEDLRFVLALHEASVVGLATGLAIATNEPALAILHTTAGLGNAVAALATARVNRAPLVVLVGQQDRRHLALQPFLAGRLEGLAGEYPVSVEQPIRAQDVPGAISRAYHAARTHRGPALVIVPMDDWAQPVDQGLRVAAPARLVRAAEADEAAVEPLVALLEGARSPALVVGAGADEPDTWEALVALAERLAAPVWQEAFSARAGFPQDHPLFAGFLSHARDGLHRQLGAHDVVLSVGAPVFRQYAYVPGPLLPEGLTVGLITDDPDEAHRSPAAIALLAPPAAACRILAARLPAQDGPPPAGHRPPPASPWSPGTCSPRSPSACPRTPWCSRSRPPAGRSCTRASPPGATWGSSARRWAGWASDFPRPPACAWGWRIARWWRSSATAPPCTPSRACGPPRGRASARSS